MKYKLKVSSIYELGQRDNQEDSIFPAFMKSTDEDRMFVVCDGMGGHSSGEVASRLVCESISKVINELCPDPHGAFSDEDFKKALAYAYDVLDQNDDGNFKKMGTTMTFLKFHQGGATIAHIGDSRVYHVRPAAEADGTEILFQTSDHSLVNDLVKIGEMTPEEAKVSRQKNVITRAMQPNLERRPNADIHHVTDIRPGDYFMLCTDGILENMEDDNIKFIFSDAAGDFDKKLNIIIRATQDNRDNHSAYVIRVEETEGAVVVPVPEVRPDTVGATGAPSIDLRPTPDMTGEDCVEKSSRRRTKLLNRILIVAIALICCALGYLLVKEFGLFDKDTTKPTPALNVENELILNEGEQTGQDGELEGERKETRKEVWKETRRETKPEAKPKVKPEAKPKVKSEAKPETTEDVATETKTEIKTVEGDKTPVSGVDVETVTKVVEN